MNYTDDETDKGLRLIANFGLQPLFQMVKNTQESHILPQPLGTDHIRMGKFLLLLLDIGYL